MTELIGYAAAIITTACYIPQAWHVISTRRTAGISLFAYTMLFTGVLLWTVYGILLVNWPLIAANFITSALVLVILVMKIRLKE
jgi:MtN3 and saliva related transmembrane protein